MCEDTDNSKNQKGGFWTKILPSTSSESEATIATGHPPMSQLEKLKMNVQKLDHRALEEECVAWSQRATSAEEEVRSCKDRLSELQSKFVSQDEAVRKAQETAFALAASESSKAEDDEIIRSKLRVIRNQWKTFAKEWAVKKSSSIKEEEWSKVDELFARLVGVDENQRPDGLWSKQSPGKAPSILLNAELARFLGKEIMSQPFISAFAYASEPNADLKRSFSYMKVLNNLYKPEKLDKLQKHDDGMQATISYKLHS